MGEESSDDDWARQEMAARCLRGWPYAGAKRHTAEVCVRFYRGPKLTPGVL